MRLRIVPILVAALLLAAMPLFGADDAAADHGVEAGHDLEHRMVVLALQIGVILFAGYLGTRLARVLRIPLILGELIAGILIGPSLLGSLPFPGYPDGLFPYVPGALSVSPELYGFAVVASIVLLFLTGLQTDLHLFLRFALRGTAVGMTGAIFSVAAGVVVGKLLLDAGIFDPRTVFLGVVAIATSVDITARILSERNKMASAEGVVILSASVIEDVIGITLLAVVLGVDAAAGGGPAWRTALGIAARALLVWAGFTTLGILFARPISRVLKGVRSSAQIAVLSLGLALILAGLFENAGLAMVIGGYVAGLSLANTDIAYLVQEKIETVHQFFDPIFFTVIGMLVDVTVIASGRVIGFGLLFGVLAIATKVIGCGGPALALGFTREGALRIGTGMVPRGEVALVIASIGIGSGILDDELFGVTIFMTLLTTLAGPPLFSRLLMRDRQTTRFAVDDERTVLTEFSFGSRELTRFMLTAVLQAMRDDGFFVNAADGEVRTYHIRRDTVFMALTATGGSLSFTSRPEDVTLVNSLVYESSLALQQQVDRIRSTLKPVELRETFTERESRTLVDWHAFLTPDLIELDLDAADKEGAIRRLVDMLADAGRVSDREAVLSAVLERERTMSTGMKHGLAIPHGRTEGVSALSVAVGIVPRGIEFDALDGRPTHFIFLIASPPDGAGPHLQLLAGITGILNRERAREEMLAIRDADELIEYMVEHSNIRRRAG